MLKKVNEKPNIKLDASEIPHVRIADADFPAPFRSGLEYSSPARGTWNIVHTGMLIPEAHEIFVCAAGCLRGVVLTAAEMGTQDRFSTVAVRENNLLDGDMEELVIEGVTDIINKLPKRPPAVLVYTSCVHHFAGVDLDMIYATLRSRFPDIDFTDCYMNPIMRKSGLTPDQLMRSRLYMLLHEREPDPEAVAIIGGDLPTDEDSDLMRLLKGAGLKVHEITSCKSYEEYQKMAESSIYVSYNPDAVPGGDMLAERLGGIHYPLRFSFDYNEIDETFAGLAELLEKVTGKTGITEFLGKAPEKTGLAADLGETSAREKENADHGRDTGLAADLDMTSARKKENADPGKEDAGNDIAAAALKAACERELEKTKDLIGDTPVSIDYTFCSRPLGLAKLLLDHGINVTRVYVDGIPGGDRAAFDSLQKEHPDLLLYPTVHPGMRFARASNANENTNYDTASNTSKNVTTGNAEKGTAETAGKDRKVKMLAIGQKAAAFEDTCHFVNIVEGGGMNGYEAIIRTCRLMREAFLEEKDMRRLVQVKGLGCEVCIR